MTFEANASRRDLLGVAAAGYAAAVAAPAVAQEKHSPGAPTSTRAASYPKPPFPKQRQPWPGLTGKMTPRPDHGETSYRGSGRLTGCKVLITGGDSGIGRAAVIALAREGADIAINYLPEEEPDAMDVGQLVEQAGRRFVKLPGDIRNEAFCRKLVSDAAQRLGGLDVLINNAARQVSQTSILDITTEQFDTTLKTNVYAMFWLTKAAIPLMKPGSAIINTTSVTAYDPPENIIDYACTKAAIMNFTKGLAKQLASKGIRANGVAPGPVWTPLQVTGGQEPETLTEFGADTPLGRPGQPAELAPLYVALADPAFSYTTGQIFGATGGRGGP
ncbi:SDR family oxidoreductase [Novosphingobium resinovorum]|uniref:SDR family oxidoreductase n=1 Tax=Novosphingobium TaxID=165696 RepID=UPI001B3C734D|nr:MULTISPECIES: SDR family oxidoreductase [Novosphingobium]MBF7013842.1 SDR family oxidoreductase [Novosphingobium sp. HR1a]WJM25987.1 SDR family oxidoreductase [Novosphingobium resinovorum]